MDSTIDLSIPYKRAKHEVIARFERAYVQALLEQHAGNVSQAARSAGIDRMSLHKIITRHRLRLTRES